MVAEVTGLDGGWMVDERDGRDGSASGRLGSGSRVGGK
jgi:hypothetical protein